MFILLLAYRHNSLCSSTTYRSNDHGCMSMIVNLPDVVPQHPCPTLIYCALVQYSVSATGGFQIFSFNSTLCIVLKNTSLHMWAKLAGCPSHTESIRKVISFHFTSLFLFFKQRWKIPQARSRSCLRQRSGSMKKGQERGELWREDVSLEKTAESKFFSLWGELRGALFLFLAREAAVWCVITCSFLHSGTRTFRVSTLDSDVMAWTDLTLSISLSLYPTAWQKSNESSILGNPDCLTVNGCAVILF